jgi:hypothetical protein
MLQPVVRHQWSSPIACPSNLLLAPHNNTIQVHLVQLAKQLPYPVSYPVLHSQKAAVSEPTASEAGVRCTLLCS